MTDLYLASQNQRHAKLLKPIGMDFEVLHLSTKGARDMNVDETTALLKKFNLLTP